MTFSASSNRILVTNGSTTVFDSNDDIPHVLGTVSLTGIAANFPSPGFRSEYLYTDFCGSTYYYTYCHSDLTLGSSYGCSLTPQTGTTYDYVCLDFGTGVPFCYLSASTYYYYTYDCATTYYYYFNYVCDPPVQQCIPIDVYGNFIVASEWSSTVDLADMPQGVDCDFVLVNVSASRNSAGTDNLYGGALNTPLPAGWVSMNGSMLVEASLLQNGSSWFKRIISIFPDHARKKLVMELKQSITRQGVKNTSSPASNFSLDIKAFFGRFR